MGRAPCPRQDQVAVQADQITDGEAPYYWPQVFRRAANLYRNSSYEAIFQALPDGGVSPKYVLDLTEPYTGPPLGDSGIAHGTAAAAPVTLRWQGYDWTVKNARESKVGPGRVT